MSNITAYPLQDGFETTLAQSWNGAIGTVYLNTAPSFTFPSGVKTYIVVNPGKTNMQVGEIDSLHVGNKTVNVSSISVGSGAGTTYTQQSHSVGSTVIISDNYQFWKNIVDAVNSKMDLSGGTFTGDVSFSGTGTEFRLPNLTTAERLALTPGNGTIVYDSTLGENYQYIAGAWNAFAAGSTQPNASTTVAGKVEIATTAQSIAGTDTGETGALLSVLPSDIAKNAQSSTFIYGTDVGGDDTYVFALTPVLAAYTTGQSLYGKVTTANTGACTADFGPGVKNIKTLDGNNPPNGAVSGICHFIYDGTNLVLQKATSDVVASYNKFGGTGADGAVDGTADVTITGSNNTYIVKNYSSWAAGTAARICTVTPTNCITHIKIRGDADFSNWTFNFAGKGATGGAAAVVGSGGQQTGTVGTASSALFQITTNAGGLGGLRDADSGNIATSGGGGGAGSSAAGSASSTAAVSSASAAGVAGGAKAVDVVLTYIQGMRRIIIAPGAGGGSGGAMAGGGASSATSGVGGAGGGALIIEVGGNLTLDNGTTVITCNGAVGGNASAVQGGGNPSAAGGGGGGGGGSFYCMYNGTLTGTVTPTVAGGAGGTQSSGPPGDGAGSNGGAGGAGLQLIEQNVVFS